MGNRRQIKKDIFKLLKEEELPFIMDQLENYQTKELINPLFSAICRSEAKIKWHGVSCLGLVVAQIADADIESARIIMRRFLWSLNDESGGIGWGAPETMAEAMVNNSQLRKEYLHMLVSYMKHDGPELFQDGNYLELPQLQRGLLWGVNRIAEEFPDELDSFDFVVELGEYLLSPDHEVRVLAGMVAIILNKSELYDLVLSQGEQDSTPIAFYNDGAFTQKKYSEIVEQSRLSSAVV